MTIQELGNVLTNEDGSYDRSKAVRLHTQVVAAAATSAQSVIRDLDLLSRGPEAVDAAEILGALLAYAEDETDRQLLTVLAGAADQLREVTLNLPPEQAGSSPLRWCTTSDPSSLSFRP